MTFNKAKLSIVAAILAGTAAIPSANASLFNVNLEYGDTPSLTIEPFNTAPPFAEPGRLRIFPESGGNTPASVTGFADGDTVQLNVTFTGSGLQLQDTGSPFFGPTEFMSFGALTLSGWDQGTDNPANDPVVTYDITTTITITGFSGSLTNTVFNGSATGVTQFAPTLGFGASFDFTSSIANITSLTFVRTFSNFQFLAPFDGLSLPADFEGLGQAIIIDDSADVPAPGALALLGLGLMGIGVRRRFV